MIKDHKFWGATLLLFALSSTGAYLLAHQEKMLLAPMIGGLDDCLFRSDQLQRESPQSRYAVLCQSGGQSASALVEQTLKKITDKNKASNDYRLGYTLNVPLLNLFKSNGKEFEIDQNLITRVINTIKNTQRPVVVYLYSNHFEQGSALENSLSNSTDNFLVSNRSRLSSDKYYGANIYPWSFIDIENDITRYRKMAIEAMMAKICQLPRNAIERINGITLLGELHHMFPDFQAGMGFQTDYIITDYSQASALNFKAYLRKRFKNIEELNLELSSDYQSFQEVQPPSKNIRTQPLNRFFEHNDAYADGVLPISGWVAVDGAHKHTINWIHVYDNGVFLGKAPVGYARQDVILAHPEFQTADVGWQFNYNYAKSAPGLHTLDVYLGLGSSPLVHLGSRTVALMERTQAVPRPMSSNVLPLSLKPDASIHYFVDSPVNLSSYYFNPLVPIWNDFRSDQVKAYISYFGEIVKKSCIDPGKVFSHQILPFVNPGWDQTKFGLDKSVGVPGDINLGVSLYGESTYGTSFLDWYKTTGRKSYGVTEFHPLKAMNAVELASVFSLHAANNAKFISFFVESVAVDTIPVHKKNIFSFDLDNKISGSDVNYRSLQYIMR